MSKISISLPDEVIEFVDRLGANRSRIIASILNEYRKRRETAETTKAYEEYDRFCKKDDENWWADWEASSLKDLGGEQ